jgi:hypothetical protein
MYNYKGEWRFEITELVGFGSRGDNQQRIKGEWLFRFVVPRQRSLSGNARNSL